MVGIVQRLGFWCLVGFLVLIVGALGAAVLATRLFGMSYILVAGGSMEPTIPYGSVAITREVDAARVEVGDIIVYTDPRSGAITTHRVVAIQDDGRLVTRGDANNVDDPEPVPPDAVRARYLFAIPHLGKVADWIRSPAGYVVLILLPGVTVIAWESASLIRGFRGSHDSRATPEI